MPAVERLATAHAGCKPGLPVVRPRPAAAHAIAEAHNLGVGDEAGSAVHRSIAANLPPLHSLSLIQGSSASPVHLSSSSGYWCVHTHNPCAAAFVLHTLVVWSSQHASPNSPKPLPGGIGLWPQGREHCAATCSGGPCAAAGALGANL